MRDARRAEGGDGDDREDPGSDARRGPLLLLTIARAYALGVGSTER